MTDRPQRALTGPCMFCGEAIAPLGFRPPGPRSRLPADKRDKYIRTCTAEACKRKARARINALPGFGTAPPPAPPKPKAAPAVKPPPPDQGQLF